MKIFAILMLLVLSWMVFFLPALAFMIAFQIFEGKQTFTIFEWGRYVCTISAMMFFGGILYPFGHLIKTLPKFQHAVFHSGKLILSDGRSNQTLFYQNVRWSDFPRIGLLVPYWCYFGYVVRGICFYVVTGSKNSDSRCYFIPLNAEQFEEAKRILKKGCCPKADLSFFRLCGLLVTPSMGLLVSFGLGSLMQLPILINCFIAFFIVYLVLLLYAFKRLGQQ